jgi:RNA ligase.
MDRDTKIRLESQERILPKFARTFHLPLEPNASRDDLIAPLSSLSILKDHTLVVEEKVDGANVGITIHEGQPVIRNRNYILNKGYGRKDTPAKKQYAPLWNWFYSNTYKFLALEKLLGFTPSVYGEWLYARHTIEYDRLPDYFIAYDIYCPDEQKWLAPSRYRAALEEAGFSVVPKVAWGPVSQDELKLMRDERSEFSSTSQCEGLYLKTATDLYGLEYCATRLKMVRNAFITDDHWNNKSLVTNKLTN